MTILNAKNIIGTGLPHEDGRKLAQYIFDNLSIKKEFNINLSDCKPKLLISAFFNTFLQTIYDNNSSLLDSARQINWILKYDFQKKNVSRWMINFKPELKMNNKTASVKVENDTDCVSVMNQVNSALSPHGLTFEYDEDKYWEDICACAWHLKSVKSKVNEIDPEDHASKLLRISLLISKYKDNIVEFGIFPIQHSYPNGTMMACHSVELQACFQPMLNEEEVNEFVQLGFRVFKSDIVDEATAVAKEMNWT